MWPRPAKSGNVVQVCVHCVRCRVWSVDKPCGRGGGDRGSVGGESGDSVCVNSVSEGGRHSWSDSSCDLGALLAIAMPFSIGPVQLI